MKELKFRARDTEQNFWVEGLTLILHTSGNQIHVPPYIELTWALGYQDKTGRDIYSKDIVKSWCWTKPHVIKWPYDVYDFIEYGLGASAEDSAVEVIGNMYENPELIPHVPED